MKPVTYDFDVVTDAPAPARRAPEAAEPAPQADAQQQPRRAAPADDAERVTSQAAE